VKEEVKEKMRTLYKNGLNDSEISRKAGVSRVTVRKWRWENDLQPNTRVGGTKEPYNQEKVTNLSHTEARNLYERAMLLHKRGWGQFRIARELNLYPATVKGWLYEGKNPSRKYEYTPNLEASPDLSYVLGVNYGDLSTFTIDEESGKQYWIALVATDREFVDQFNTCVCRVLGKDKEFPVFRIKKEERKDLYGIHFASRLLWDYLNKPLEKHKPVAKNYPLDFLRGVYDSEGSLEKERERIRIISTNLDLLEFLKKIIESVFNPSSLFMEERRRSNPDFKTCYALGFRDCGFSEKVKPTIKRKRL